MQDVSSEKEWNVRKQGSNKKSAEFGSLLSIFQAYNQKEISFREWMEWSRGWAENVLRSSVDEKE